MSKINITALHGFMSGDSGAALHISGDENAITISKGERLEAWLADKTKIVDNDGAETTVQAENIHRMKKLLVQWLHGEELDI